MLEIIAKRVRELRTAQGLTQEELAHRIGATSRAISNIEGRRSPPSLEMLEALARGLRVPVAALVQLEPKGETERLEQRLRATFSMLSIDDQRLAAAVLDAIAAQRVKSDT